MNPHGSKWLNFEYVTEMFGGSRRQKLELQSGGRTKIWGVSPVVTLHYGAGMNSSVQACPSQKDGVTSDKLLHQLRHASCPAEKNHFWPQRGFTRAELSAS